MPSAAAECSKQQAIKGMQQGQEANLAWLGKAEKMQPDET